MSRPDSAELYFESHVTIEPVFDTQLEQVAQIARRHKFRVADLLMQKRREDSPERSRNDTFCTGRGTSLEDLQQRMCALVYDLRVSGFKVWRYKIEDTVMDSKYDDVLGLL